MAQRGLIQTTLPESFARAAAAVANRHGSAHVRPERVALCVVFTRPQRRRRRAVLRMLDTLRTRLYKMKKQRVTHIRLYNAGEDSGLGVWAAERRLGLQEVSGEPGEIVGPAKVAVLLWDMARAEPARPAALSADARRHDIHLGLPSRRRRHAAHTGKRKT